ncbi:MAG: hypothetical protein EBQ96_02710 [Proteobacteria bacterium]|nr:hypothetical protein [Pseudomonadota bacterium]
MIDFLRKFLSSPLLQEPKTVVPLREDAPRIFARVFGQDDGQRVLSYLRATVNARSAGPESSEAMLRYMDGQRALLQTIQGLVDQGRG